MVKRVVVGAHYGFRDWLVQRLTAVVMLAYTVALLAAIVLMPVHDFESWRQFFQCAWVRVLSSVTVVALMWHAWIGVRDIWMDYVKPVALRVTLHTLTLCWLVGGLIYSMKVLWGN